MWEEQALQSQKLPKTLSHELVHAYLKSLTGSAGFDAFPIWYDEGLAIYFSGSGEDTSIVTPNGQIVVTPTEDYKHYQIVFDYLEAELGRAQLLTLWTISGLEILLSTTKSTIPAFDFRRDSKQSKTCQQHQQDNSSDSERILFVFPCLGAFCQMDIIIKTCTSVKHGRIHRFNRTPY